MSEVIDPDGGPGVVAGYSPLYPLHYEPIVRRSLEEDLGRAGDLTTDAIVPPDARASGRIVARRAGRVTGEDFEVVVWTYTNDAVVLSEASAHVWLPVREAASEGLESLAAWHRGESEGPIQLVYSPTVYENPTGHEVDPPRRLFEPKL